MQNYYRQKICFNETYFLLIIMLHWVTQLIWYDTSFLPYLLILYSNCNKL